MLYDFDDEVESPEVILETIVKALVGVPEEVEIEVQEADSTLILTIDVLPEDRGKIIGRRGVIIQSLKTIFKAVGGKMRRQVLIQIKDS